MMRFALSNRQAKELANGKLLRIALPHPGGEVDPVRFVAQTLAVTPDEIVGAYESHVTCLCPHGDQGGDVEQQVGTIHREQATPAADDVLYRVHVIVAELCHRARARGEYPIQWPGRIL